MSDSGQDSNHSSIFKEGFFLILIFFWAIFCLFTMGLLNMFLQPETDQVYGHVEEETEWFEEYREIKSTINGRQNYRDEYRCYAFLNYTYTVNEEVFFGNYGEPVEYTVYKSSVSCIDTTLQYYNSSFNISVWYYPDDPANSRLTEDVEEITSTVTCCCCFQFFIGVILIQLGKRKKNQNNTSISFKEISASQSMTISVPNKTLRNTNLIFVFLKKIIGICIIILSILPLYIVYEAYTKPTLQGNLTIPFICCGFIGILIGLVLLFPTRNNILKTIDMPIVIIEDDKTVQEEIEPTQDIDWWNTSTEDN